MNSITNFFLLLTIVALLLYFGNSKKRLFAKMSSNVWMSQMAVSMMLMGRFNFDSAQTDEDRNTVSTKAAAWANYLFGKTPSEQHAHLDLQSEHHAARDWLIENDLARELVVQSIRVANTVAYGRSGSAPEIGLELLAKFGAEFPDAPTPATYEILVNRAIASLSPENQQSLRAWARKGFKR